MQWKFFQWTLPFWERMKIVRSHIWDLVPNLFRKNKLRILWKNPTILKLRVKTETNLLDIPWAKELVYGGERRILVRLGYLVEIESNFQRKLFSGSPIKLGECFVRTRDVHSNGSYGQVNYRLLGYFWENPKDEYLLAYFGLPTIQSEELRSILGETIWNYLPQHESPNFLWEDMGSGTIP